MMRHFLIVCFAGASLSCASLQTQTPAPSDGLENPATSNSQAASEARTGEAERVIESFADESKIGRPHRNRIEIDVVERPVAKSAYKPSNLARIRLYSINPSHNWVLRQTLELEDHALADSDPKIEDFNNDGLKDITWISNTAARGANVVRTLLVYDKKTDSLIQVKNSEDYPNLAYNKTLHCIDAWMIHGTSTTVFLRLEGDRLIEFASVGTGQDRVVSVIGKDGTEREISRVKMKEDDVYTRYRTFDPPRP